MLYQKLKASSIIVIVLILLATIHANETHQRNSNILIDKETSVEPKNIEKIERVLNIKNFNQSYERADEGGSCPPDNCGCTDDGGVSCDCGVVNGHCYCKICSISSSLEIEEGIAGPNDEDQNDTGKLPNEVDVVYEKRDNKSNSKNKSELQENEKKQLLNNNINKSEDNKSSLKLTNRVEIGGTKVELSEEEREKLKQYFKNKSSQNLSGREFGLSVALQASENDNVESVTFNNETDSFEIRHNEEVKMFGLFRIATSVKTSIDPQGNIKEKYPWWAILASKPKNNEVKFKAGTELSGQVN